MGEDVKQIILDVIKNFPAQKPVSHLKLKKWFNFLYVN